MESNKTTNESIDLIDASAALESNGTNSKNIKNSKNEINRTDAKFLANNQVMNDQSIRDQPMNDHTLHEKQANDQLHNPMSDQQIKNVQLVCQQLTMDDQTMGDQSTNVNCLASEQNLYTRLQLVTNPTCLAQFNVDDKNNFFKGCKWSNDGSCLMTCSNDKTLKLFNLPSNFSTIPVDFNSTFNLNIDLQVREGGLIYDYCFNPNLNSLDSSSCFLLTTSHGSPIHMFDAYTGRRLNSYVAYTDTEEETFAYSLTVNQFKNRIYAGYRNAIRFYDLNRPGKHSDLLETYYQKEGQQGLITCLTINPSNTDIFAAGSYSKQLALYSEQGMEQICVILGHEGGLTHMKFSLDGTKLFTGSRKENEIFTWDIRYLSRVLYTLKRNANTNQRIYFDTNSHSNYLVSGGLDGRISFFNLDEIDKHESHLESAYEPKFEFKAHNDCVNGASLHPFYPLLASCSGERKFKQLNENDENSFFSKEFTYDNSLKLWWLTEAQQFNDLYM